VCGGEEALASFGGLAKRLWRARQAVVGGEFIRNGIPRGGSRASPGK
jgi:hypothetical protein